MNIIIAGGGTGGHLFPGIAIAQEFKNIDDSNNITFIGSEKGLEAKVLPKLKLPLKTIPVKGFAGKSINDKAAAICYAAAACIKTMCYLKKIHADIIIGLGGYVSFPAVLSGFIMGIPTAIHEQNSVPGLSNRILGKISTKVFLSYGGGCTNFFQKQKTVIAGMPVRNIFKETFVNTSDTPLQVLVLGGSQGSRQINQSIMDALPHLTGLKNRIRFIHQSGRNDMDTVKTGYINLGFQAHVTDFIENMYDKYQQAHIVISRSGASTLAELALCAKASILIPYPFASGNHQKENARFFVENGAALMIESSNLNGEKIASELTKLEKQRFRINEMGQCAKVLAMPQAAETIVRECYKTVKQRGCIKNV